LFRLLKSDLARTHGRRKPSSRIDRPDEILGTEQFGPDDVVGDQIGGYAMRVFLGMILGALLLVAFVYIYDSQTTSTVASGQNASASRTIVNWDVAAADWHALKARAHEDWIRLSSR
jgi:hypothetical protein